MAAVPKALQARTLEEMSRAYCAAFWDKPRRGVAVRLADTERQRAEAHAGAFYHEWGIPLKS